jgi:hypothetical protein
MGELGHRDGAGSGVGAEASGGVLESAAPSAGRKHARPWGAGRAGASSRAEIEIAGGRNRARKSRLQDGRRHYVRRKQIYSRL